MERIPEIYKEAGKIRITPRELSSKIDHTELSPYATETDLEKLCEEAADYDFHSVAVSPYYTEFCADKLDGEKILVDPTIGFPLGQNKPEIKALEAEKAIEDGADELDMVMNIGAFKDGKYEFVKKDIESVVKAAPGKPVKVIIESGYLTYEEIPKACEIVKKAGADYVKNSTGFGPYGANIPHICQMRKSVGENFGVKAAGGIHDFRDALKMIAAGADRIGASSGTEIVDSYKETQHASWSIEDPCKSCPSSWVSESDVPKSVENHYRSKCTECKFG